MGIVMNKPSMLHQAAFRMSRVAQAARALAVLAGMAGPGWALAQMSFPTAPPLATSSAGALPNIILAIDNSSSMIYNKDVGFGGGEGTRLEALIAAINNSFGDPSMTGKFRLAYESMFYDAGFGDNRYFKSTYDNSMKLFDANYQTNFIAWVNTLSAHTGSGDNAHWSHVGPETPSQWMMIYAGEYLKGNVLASNDAGSLTCSQDWCPNLASSPLLSFVPVAAEKNPWNATQPSTAAPAADPNPLSCRRAYFIFMTDGIWTINPVASNGHAPYVSTISGNAADQNYDAAPHTLGDGSTQYDPSQPYGHLYADATNFNKETWNASSTMADWAFYYWANDLQPTIDNQVASQITVSGDQTFTSGAYSATYPQYWNPKNDPATWQHMNTYTIGFGGSSWLHTAGRTSWPYNFPSAGAGIIEAYSGNDYNAGREFRWPPYNAGNPADDGDPASACPITVPGFDGNIYGSFFSAYASGAVQWPTCTGRNAGPDNLMDTVHAAYNGRGKFYPATSSAALTQAFQDILQTAIAQSAPTGAVASAAASSSRLTGGAVAYAAGYTYDNTKAGNYNTAANTWDGGTIDGWSGSLTAYNGASMPASVLWTASIPASRNILTADSAGHGIAFRFGAPNLTAADGLSAVNVTTVRGNPLGDIVNSQLVYVGNATRMSMDAQYASFSAFTQTRAGMVYVGANDGMLHGFNAGSGTVGNPGTGAEVMAYIPRGLVGKLPLFSQSGSYVHNYWVDGSAFSGDAQLATPGLGAPGGAGNWGTVLVGALGAGGKGYFVLDVTNPALLTEGNAGAVVRADMTGPDALAAHPEIGYQFSPPVMDMYTVNQSAQIVKLNTADPNGEWGVIMGNGYNSAGGLPVLLIQSLSAGGGLYAVSASCTTTPAACIAAGNGLGAPRPVDVDGNGTADIVYAGDLLGNLWKFDISSPTRGNWNVAFGGSPLFKAVGPTGVAQPITSAPAVVPDAQSGGFIVAFGTGKNLVTADQGDTNLNSVYGLYDHQPMEAKTMQLSPTAAISYIQLDNGMPINCLTGAGPARYGCLYRQSGGSMDAGAQHGSVTSNTSSTLSGQTFDGTAGAGSGWYFDIPDVDNGNGAKVLLNPTVLSGNTLMFFSNNVASASVSGAGPAVGAESCGGSVLNGALTTVNYFDLLTGNAPDNTFIVGGVTFDPQNNPGNRFRIEGAQTYIPNGSDALQGVEQDASVRSVAPIRAGRRAGWRISR